MKTTAPAIPWPDTEPVIALWPIAGMAFKVSRPRAYYLAKRGDFPCPVLRVGDRWMVRTVDLRQALGLPLAPIEDTG